MRLTVSRALDFGHRALMRWLMCVAVVCSALVAAGQEKHLRGTIKERVDGGGYSYLRIATEKGERWAAVPQTMLTVGEPVRVDVQTDFNDFASPTLKRTWKVLSFGTVAGTVDDPHVTGLPKTLPETPSLEGRVLEKLDAAAYSYLRLATKDREVWVAVPTTKAEVGAVVRVRHPVEMGAFKSPTLGRTFNEIVFGTLEP